MMDDTTPGTMLPDRAVLRVAGDDARGFLQGLLTQDMLELTADAPRWAGLLTPQGKALFDFLLWADDGAVLIDCEADRADALARRLAIYRLRRAITTERVEGAAVHWSPDGNKGTSDPRLAALGRRWIAPPAALARGWIGHRLALGVTEGVAELGEDKTLWLECNADLLNGVSFAKGCYVGQENTARMHYRGKVNRRLVTAPIRNSNDKQRAVYPELGIAVELRRVEALSDAYVPDWLAAGIATTSE